ncbi:MAG TPA: DNA polymerase domain-containing protein, partial [Candidatus Nanoarchaeia archaeon]|nr:DNA polymerase domain-containing protein [Candidatus Nanoarchaeia archaeon]
KGRKTKVEKIELKEKKFLGKPVKALKIWGTNYKDLHDIADKLGIEKIEKRRGYDLGLMTNYIIEKKLKPLTWYKITGEILHQSNEFGGIDNILEVDFVIKLENKKELEKQTKYSPRILAYDIETDSLKPEEGETLMVSLRGKNFKKVISWKKAKTKKEYVEFVKNEKELIKKFTETVKKYSPDFLIGYNSDFFDLPFLKQRARKVRTKFPLGKDSSEPKISRGTSSTGKIEGIIHIDLLKFIKTAYAQYMKSETLSLNEVSKEFLEDTKKDFKIQHSSKLKEGHWDDYYEYNLHDSTLTMQLFEKFWPDLLEFSKIIEEPVFDISRNGLSKQIEYYILHNLEKYNEIPEKRPGHNEIEARKTQGGVEGAFVYEPKPGIYENLAMFDFTSMHTSIIISHNISKGTLLLNSKSPPPNSYESPEIEIERKKKKFYFTKEPGFFPLLMKEIFEKRKQFKKEYKKNPNPITLARSNAFKVLSASAHGYIGFSGARYYSREASSSILAFVRKYNKETILKIENKGYKVIFGDTDSVAFTREKSTKQEIKDLLEKLNNELPGVMHLELEGFFKRGIWVTTRSGETGAKKKYAMIDENKNIKIRGFETVRRDWCQLARKTQDKVLRLILKYGDEKKALEYIKTIINKLKKREIDKEELLIKTQLKKPINEYKAISPHVVAAKKMKERGIPVGIGTLIEYYIAESNTTSKLVRDKAKLTSEKGKYDIKYYLEKQILPSVEQIFHVFKIEIKEIIDGKKQDKLSKWF